MILIGVKSKYGSCNGNCTGRMNINKKNIKINFYINSIWCKVILLVWFKSKFGFFIILITLVFFYYNKEGSICWLMGWAVNSIVFDCRRFDSFSS